ncbi:MAG TPA: hydroxymethylbilane synthase [Dehalococcoidia bacterium]|nr:hydroxymethylbilane synthase [Dehalococcoidia bacterium]
MSPRTFIVGTRGSALALTQTGFVVEALRKAHPGTQFETVTIHTEGDRSAASLSEIGGRGVFVIEIERALLAGEIDIAVHSLKDLPADETAGLAISAVYEREDPRDVLVSRAGVSLDHLPAGAVIGTGSPRRAAQVMAARPDLAIADIRGNVDTRLRKVADGEYDATVLAAAGLSRLGWLDRATQVFETEQMLPAVGQGALAVQTRADDADAVVAVSALDHAPTRAAVTAERAFERRLGGGCHAAIAAYAVILSGTNPGGRDDQTSRRNPAEVGKGSTSERGANTARERLYVRGLVGDAAGTLLRDEIEGDAADAESLGIALAERLIELGAGAMLEAAG